MGIQGIEQLSNSACEEWWKDPRIDSSGKPIVDHNHICTMILNHKPPCKCKCGVFRPIEDYN